VYSLTMRSRAQPMEMEKGLTERYDSQAGDSWVVQNQPKPIVKKTVDVRYDKRLSDIIDSAEGDDEASFVLPIVLG
jgi:hypothetical protein